MPYFATDQQDVVLEFMQKNAFITLVGFDGTFPVSTQVPVKVVKTGNDLSLIGHIMNKTDHHVAFKQNPNVLAIFTGPHAYVSASVYEQPAVASTWNYMTVQAKGIIRLMDQNETYEVIKEITNKYEHPERSPAAFHKMDEEYIQKNLKAISGFEIKILKLDHVFKLSQNHSPENQKRIINYLEQEEEAGAKQVAKEMKGKRIK